MNKIKERVGSLLFKIQSSMKWKEWKLDGIGYTAQDEWVSQS